IPTTPVHNYLYLNNGDLKFSDASKDAGFDLQSLSNGAASADLDNDGDLDLVVNHLNAPSEIYRNMLVEEGNGGNWINFEFKGIGANKNGIGASINLYFPKGVITLENYPVRGYQSS